MCSVRNGVVSVCILQSVVNFFQLQMMCLVCIQLRWKGRLIVSLWVVTSVPVSYHDCFCFIELRSSSEMGEPAAGLDPSLESQETFASLTYLELRNVYRLFKDIRDGATIDYTSNTNLMIL